MPGVSHRGPTTGVHGVGKVHFRFKEKKPRRSLPVKIIGTFVYALFFSFAFFSYGWKYLWLRNNVELPMVRLVGSALDRLILAVKGTIYSIPASISRDTNGIPQIQAVDLTDALQQQGYVHAMDRWLQMDLSRRTAFGELSEVYGEKTLLKDRLAKSLQFGKRAAEDINMLGEEEVALLEAYAAGVNKYLEEDKVMGYNAYDYFIAFGVNNGYSMSIRPWRPIDSLAIMRLQVYEWGHGWEQDLFGSMFSFSMDVPGLQFIAKRCGNNARGADSVKGNDRYSNDACLSNLNGRPSALLPSFSGSTIGVSGSHSESGGALLAADFYAPATSSTGLWHLINIQSPQYTAAGAGIAGIPFVFMGRNKHVGWALSLPAEKDGTGVSSEIVTLLRETDEEFVTGQLETIAIATEEYGVYKYDSYIAEESSKYGVVIPESVFDSPFNETLRDISVRSGHASKFALLSPAVEEGTSFQFLRQLNMAHNLEDASQSVANFKALHLNVVLADENGGVVHASSRPTDLSKVHDSELTNSSSDGKLTVPEKEEKTVLVTDLVIFSEVIFDSVTTGQSRPVTADSPAPHTCAAVTPSRVESLIRAMGPHHLTVDKLKDVLMDTYSPSAKTLAALMHSVALQSQGKYAAEELAETVLPLREGPVAVEEGNDFLGKIKYFFQSPSPAPGRVLRTWSPEREQRVFQETRHIVHDFDGHHDAPGAASPSTTETQRSAPVLVEAFRFTLIENMQRFLSKTKGCHRFLQQQHIMLGGSISPIVRMSVDLRRDPLLFFDAQLHSCFADREADVALPSSKDIVVQLAEKSILQAYDFCEKELGSDWSKWSWGQLHTIHFKHASTNVPVTKVLSQSVLALGPVPAAGTGDSIMRSESARFAGGQVSNAVARDAFVSDENSFSSSVRMVLDMNDKIEGIQFSVPTSPSSGLFSARWYGDGALARWGSANERFRMNGELRTWMTHLFVGNSVAMALGRGVQAVALTLHDVLKLMGVTALQVFEGDVLFSKTTDDGIFYPMRL